MNTLVLHGPHLLNSRLRKLAREQHSIISDAAEEQNARGMAALLRVCNP
jgi:hypothetical protein